MSNNRQILRILLFVLSIFVFAFLYVTEGNSLMKSIMFGVLASILVEITIQSVRKYK